jgi:uncharacterized protein (TIGR03067 family)
VVLRRSGVPDEQKLQGTWAVVSSKPRGQVDGEVVFAGDKLRTISKSGKKTTWTFQVVSFTRPARIDITVAEGNHTGLVTHLGAYELDGDRLKMCLTTYPEGKRPTSVTARPKEKQTEIVLKRVKK